MNRLQHIPLLLLSTLLIVWGMVLARPVSARLPIEEGGQPASPDSTLNFSGTVYEGVVGNSTPLANVTLQLYGAQNTATLGSWLQNATSGVDGTYNLGTSNTSFAYYNIIEIVPDGYSFWSASSHSGGTVVGQTIRFASPAPGTYVQNDFYDKRLPTPTPTATETATPTATNTATATATATATPTPTNTPLPTATPTTGTLQGTVWNDLNGNATKDVGEPGLANAQLILRDSHNALVGSHTTGSDGTYSFSNLAPGSYSITEVDPPGYTSTTPSSWVLPISANTTLVQNFGDWIPVTFTPTPTATATPTETPSPTPTPSVSPTPGTVVILAIAPATSNVSAGDIFTVDIQVQAGAQAVQAVDAFLNFDPAYLQVVDAGGAPTNTILPGTSLDTVFLNQVDNVQGKIDFSAATFGTPPAGTFTLATVRLKALAGNLAGTQITFSTTAPRQSEAAFGGQSVLGGTSDGLVIIGGPTATPSSTATATATSTPSSTPTNTPTATTGPSETPTATGTATATATASPTATSSPTATATFTPSPVGTVPTATPSPTATLSPTPGLDLSAALPLTCGSHNEGDTRGLHSGVSQYACRIWDESGPEQVYVLTTTLTQDITATLIYPPVIDLDVFILDGPNPNFCVGQTQDTYATYHNAPPGTYYIVVDGFKEEGAPPSEGPYTLDVSCPLEPVQATATPTVTPSPTATATPSATPGAPPDVYLPIIRHDPSPTPTVTPTPNPYDIGVNAGGPVYTDSLGFVWQADAKYGVTVESQQPSGLFSRFWSPAATQNLPPAGTWGYDPGTAVPESLQVGTTTHAVGGTDDPALYQTEHWGMSAYRFDVPAGHYNVELRFAEIFYLYSHPGDRVFDVQIEGQTVLPNYDIVQTAGQYVAVVKFFPAINVTDGRLDVEFIHHAPEHGYAKISAIRIMRAGD